MIFSSLIITKQSSSISLAILSSQTLKARILKKMKISSLSVESILNYALPWDHFFEFQQLISYHKPLKTKNKF